MDATPPERSGEPIGPDARVGQRYRVIRELGAGGMGTVYEAVNTWTGRRVAIKFMNQSQGAEGRSTLSAERVERFMREARATAKVRHPHAVDVLDMGQDAERAALYIVYELLEGEPLRARLDRQPVLRPDEAKEILLPVMEALAAAHDAGVVHRDLKPENIFLSRDLAGGWVPKVIDFGIARLNEDADGMPSLTRTGAAMGTARYMSPEQARGLKDVDARTDVWAAGVVWFEALTGRPPYDGQSYNEVLSKLLTSDPPALPEALAGGDPALCAAIDGALQRDRDTRHPTMRRFIDAIHGAAREAPATERASTPAPAPVVVKAPGEVSRARFVLGGVLLGALLGAVIGGAVLGGASTAPRTPPAHVERTHAAPRATTAPTLPTPEPVPQSQTAARAEAPVAPPALAPLVRPRRRPSPDGDAHRHHDPVRVATPGVNGAPVLEP